MKFISADKREPLCMVVSETSVQVLFFPHVNDENEGLIVMAPFCLLQFVCRSKCLALLILLCGCLDSGKERLVLEHGTSKRLIAEHIRTQKEEIEQMNR